MSLPLKAKTAIRDLWTSNDAPAARAISALENLLGLRPSCDPEWKLLLNELDSVYTDEYELVAAITSTIQVWFCAMTELLQEGDDNDGADDKWAEDLLASLCNKRSRGLTLFIEVTQGPSPKTRRDESRGAFVLSLPNTQIIQASNFLPTLKSQLFVVFDPPETKAADWADIRPEAVPVDSKLVTNLPSHPVPEVSYLADVATLPRPDELLLRPPYHLFVHGGSSNSMEIQCSHSPSLEFLAAYLKKWCRSNHSQTQRPPIVTITLHQSPFGLGLIYDTLTLATEIRRTSPLSPTIVLSLVESVLGYQKVYSDGSTWQYRKDGLLKKLS